MNSNKKRHIFSMIFLVYFVVFAISPLSYPYTAKKMAQNFSAFDRTSCLSKGIDIFFVEFICAKLVSGKGVPHSAASSAIILRKERAVLPEDVNTKIVNFEDISAAETHVAPVAYPLSRLAIFIRFP
jgi:hypothetical protein